MTKGDAPNEGPDQIFDLIEKWPECMGTDEWRKRAHRELSPKVHELFIVYANSKKDFGDEEGEATCTEWEFFNAMRSKQFRRQKTFDMITGFFDGAVGIVALFGAFWLFIWFYDPSEYSAFVLCAHVAVIIGWAILRWVRWRSALREKRKLRFEYQSAEDAATP